MDDLRRERTDLFDEMTELLYFMRGAIQYDDVWDMTPFERNRMHGFLEKRMAQEKEKPPGVARIY